MLPIVVTTDQLKVLARCADDPFTAVEHAGTFTYESEDPVVRRTAHRLVDLGLACVVDFEQESKLEPTAAGWAMLRYAERRNPEPGGSGERPRVTTVGEAADSISEVIVREVNSVRVISRPGGVVSTIMRLDSGEKLVVAAEHGGPAPALLVDHAEPLVREGV